MHSHGGLKMETLSVSASFRSNSRNSMIARNEDEFAGLVESVERLIRRNGSSETKEKDRLRLSVDKASFEFKTGSADLTALWGTSCGNCCACRSWRSTARYEALQTDRGKARQLSALYKGQQMPKHQ